jgi:hypothetical protein
MSIRNYISKDKMEKMAIEKYQQNGLGITFEDIKKEFSVNKARAQRKLKHFHDRKVLFTANDLIIEGITVLQNRSPQQYFPTCIKAEIIEGLSKRRNVQVKPTEVTSSKPPLSTLEEQKAQNLLDILFSLGKCLLYIHKLQLQVFLEPTYYKDIQKESSKFNKAKQHEVKIGKAIVKYLVYPNGKTMVYVASSNNPFKLEDETDESILYSFLGQVRDRLLYLVTDPNERIVPPITKWVLTGCDINKDVTVTDMLQLTGINIQLKEADRVFRIYIKSLGDKAIYRVEESVKLRSSLVDVLHMIRSPSETQDNR